MDFSFAFGLGAYFFYLFFDYQLLGCILASCAILAGLVDWRVRRRNPLLVKIILIMAPGFYFFLFGYIYQ